jgi:hypothetical protein
MKKQQRATPLPAVSYIWVSSFSPCAWKTLPKDPEGIVYAPELQTFLRHISYQNWVSFP